MRIVLKRLLYYWEVKQQRKKELKLFLKTHQLKCVPRRETSITLGCLTHKATNKTGKFDLVREKDGFVLESNLSLEQITKRTEALTKAARKEYPKLSVKEALEKYLDDVVNLQRFGFRFFKFAKRFDDHLEFGHIRIEVVNNNVPTKLPDGSKNPNFIAEAYEYVIGKGGRTTADILNNQSFKVKAWGGSHNFKNIDNVNVRVAAPKDSLSGNISTFKLSTGETVRKVQLEYYIKEINRWKLKDDPTTMWPNSWDLAKIKSVIKESTENITKVNGRIFEGITQDGYKVEFWINKQTKEIETAYLIF